MDSNEIKQTVELVQKIINTEEYIILKKENDIKYRNKLISLFPTFSNDYPILFKKIINNDDITMLYTMLNSINDVSSGKDEKKITTELGEMLAEKYIYPVVGAPPIKEYR
jgi:hypothetical protein